MKLIKKIAECIFSVFIYLLLAVVVVVAVAFACGIKPYVIKSGSMEPTIHTGSISFVNTKADYESVQENAILWFLDIKES